MKPRRTVLGEICHPVDHDRALCVSQDGERTAARLLEIPGHVYHTHCCRQLRKGPLHSNQEVILSTWATIISHPPPSYSRPWRDPEVWLWPLCHNFIWERKVWAARGQAVSLSFHNSRRCPAFSSIPWCCSLRASLSARGASEQRTDQWSQCSLPASLYDALGISPAAQFPPWTARVWSHFIQHEICWKTCQLDSPRQAFQALSSRGFSKGLRLQSQTFPPLSFCEHIAVLPPWGRHILQCLSSLMSWTRSH